MALVDIDEIIVPAGSEVCELNFQSSKLCFADHDMGRDDELRDDGDDRGGEDLGLRCFLFLKYLFFHRAWQQ